MTEEELERLVAWKRRFEAREAAEMKHPSEYVTEPFLDMHVMVVDPGTKVRDERSGQEIEITDKVSVRKGNVLFCTQAFYDFLRGQSTDRVLVDQLKNETQSIS